MLYNNVHMSASQIHLVHSVDVPAKHGNEEHRLMSHYHVATERYAEAVRNRLSQRVTATAARYRRLTQLMERAHLECELARMAIEKRSKSAKSLFAVSNRAEVSEL
jgi:hypothetical protein